MRMAQRHRRSVVAVTAASLILGLVLVAGAAPDKKSFTTSISPVTAVAGTSVEFTLTITNTSDSAPLGAAEITVPTGFVLDTGSVTLSREDWSVEEPVGNPFQITADTSGARLSPGQSILVSFTAMTALNDNGKDTSYPFHVEARQANNFNGAKNDLNPPREDAAVLVTGTASVCDQGQSCTAKFSAGRTSAEVSTTCAAEPCGNLILDLKKSYCDGNACAGEGVFWNPPTISSSQMVDLVLTIPKSEFGTAAVGQVKFYISTESGPFAECGTTDVACSYTVRPRGNNFVIQVTVEQIDPRAFAS